MNDDYRQLLNDKFLELGRKITERERLDAEIAKLHQFVRATLRMLPEDEQDTFEQQLNELDIRSKGLTDAIRDALQGAPSDAWITGPALRARLMESGFDFSRYVSNPLASIYAVVKRFKPTEIETTVLDGVRAFRWIGDRPAARTHGKELMEVLRAGGEILRAGIKKKKRK
jgi:hypothetical protein